MSEDHFTTYVFLGFGLIGGSIARGIKHFDPQCVIYAFDVDESNTKAALEEGVINQISATLSSHVAKADVLILAAPIGCNNENLRTVSSFIANDCLITDVGSVKGEIHKVVKDLNLESQFVGGHPMAGKETSGYASADERLLENAYYILTPTDRTQDKYIDFMKNMVTKLHAIVLISDPVKHDYATAAISHLPHLIAASLVDLVASEDSEDEFMKSIAAGGFKDLTRIASSSPAMWEHICRSNTTNITLLLTHYIDSLTSIKTILEEGHYEKIAELFASSGAYRLSLNDTQKGIIAKNYRLYVDIPDETGAIAGIASLLASHNINMMNIGITHNREMAEGVLYIVFHDEESMQAAQPILSKAGYHVMKK